jgi:hypothetical protein
MPQPSIEALGRYTHALVRKNRWFWLARTEPKLSLVLKKSETKFLEKKTGLKTSVRRFFYFIL